MGEEREGGGKKMRWVCELFTFGLEIKRGKDDEEERTEKSFNPEPLLKLVSVHSRLLSLSLFKIGWLEKDASKGRVKWW